MTNDYRPIACGAYDEIEVMAMRRAEVELLYVDEQGVRRTCGGRATDTSIHDGAEYLALESQGERREYRLDRILRIDAKGYDIAWRQNYAE